MRSYAEFAEDTKIFRIFGKENLSYEMYMATTVLFLAMPLVLASPLSFLIMLFYIPLIAKRIKNEEMVLEEGLEGYKEYKKKVRYKVIPFIW